MNRRIDEELVKLADELARKNGFAGRCATEIPGGGYVPTWCLYASEAAKLLDQRDMLVALKE